MPPPFHSTVSGIFRYPRAWAAAVSGGIGAKVYSQVYGAASTAVSEANYGDPQTVRSDFRQ